VGEGGARELGNGNYLVLSPLWNDVRGAVTWGDGTTGVHGVVSAANSLVGTTPSDEEGAYPGVVSAGNGNYVVLNEFWNGWGGAAAGGNGGTGVGGPVSAANSLVGSNPGDYVGANFAVLSNGYVVRSTSWNGARGAATWGSSTSGVSGIVSEANSLVGSH